MNRTSTWYHDTLLNVFPTSNYILFENFLCNLPCLWLMDLADVITFLQFLCSILLYFIKLFWRLDDRFLAVIVMPCSFPYCVRGMHCYFRMNQWYILWNKNKNALGSLPRKKQEEETKVQILRKHIMFQTHGTQGQRLFEECWGLLSSWKPHPASEIHELQMFGDHGKTRKSWQTQHGKFKFLGQLLLVSLHFLNSLSLFLLILWMCNITPFSQLSKVKNSYLTIAHTEADFVLLSPILPSYKPSVLQLF